MDDIGKAVLGSVALQVFFLRRDLSRWFSPNFYLWKIIPHNKVSGTFLRISNNRTSINLRGVLFISTV